MTHVSSPRESGERRTLLAIDDDPATLSLIEHFAGSRGFEVHTRGNGSEALAAVSDLRPSVILVDVRRPDVDGLEVLRELRAADPDCDVILTTADVTTQTAIAAVEGGALDCLSKPLDLSRLGDLLEHVKHRLASPERLLEVEAQIAREYEFHGMIGRSVQMQQVFDRIRRLAPHVRTVLITGETGTSKELAAQALHAEGPRRTRPFLTLNCSVATEPLFESQLFGHLPGAFAGAVTASTGLLERADGGTLFLDQVGDLPLALQAKLLRLIENGERQPAGSLETRRVDVCIIAATNAEIQSAVAAGRFRSDLYYRLSVIEIALPPLRARRGDIPCLTAAFVREFAARFKRPIVGVSASAQRYLEEAPWPGNVRELRNVIERACLLSDNRILSERDIIAASAPQGGLPAGVPLPANPLDPDASLLSTAQRDQIRRVLREAGGNKAVAARLLGISRRSLYRWLERLDIDK